MPTQYRLEFDMRGSGFTVNERAGEALGNHKLVYRGADSLWYLADRDAAATRPILGITMGAIPANRKGEILRQGYIGDTSWTWTVGGENGRIFASGTPGELTQTFPTTGVVQLVAVAVTQTMLYFNSDLGNAGFGGLLLEGETAFVGFDPLKSIFTNYWYCNGVADDVQIQAAITYVNGLGGGSIFLERGTYDITASLSIIGPNIQIIGTGDGTILTMADNTNVDMFSFTGNHEAPTFQDFEMNGNKNNNITGCGFSSRGYRGLYSNLTIRDFPESGLRLLSTGGSGNLLFEVDSYSNGEEGFLIETSDATMLRCRGFSNTQNGARIASSVTKISNCRFFSNSDNGIYSVGGKCLIMGCIVSGNVEHGIYLYATSGTVFEYQITDCIIDDNGTGGANTYDGIRIEGTASYWATEGLIQNNMITGSNHRYEISLNEYTRRAGVYNNFIAQGATANIYVNADEHEILGNYIELSVLGISITVNADLTTAKDNKFRANTTNITDLGTDTRLHELQIYVADPDGNIGDHPAVVCTDGADTPIYFGFTIPLEFQELVTAEILFVPTADGNLRHSSASDWGKIASGEAYNAGSDTIAIATLAVDQNDIEGVDISAGLTGIAGGDRVGYVWTFEGADVANTVSGYFLGVRVRYV